MIEEVRKATLSGDLIGMRIFLSALNYLLTRSASGDFQEEERTRKNLLDKLRSFLKEGNKFGFASVVLYLGDGGYSRIVLAREAQEILIGLSPVSTEEVKTLWATLS